jgi:hypothetical protein
MEHNKWLCIIKPALCIKIIYLLEDRLSKDLIL